MEDAEFTDDDTDTDEVEAEETKIAPTHLPKQLDGHIADVAVVQDDAHTNWSKKVFRLPYLQLLQITIPKLHYQKIIRLTLLHGSS